MPKSGGMDSLPILYADLVFLFAIFLCYLYSGANIIAKLIAKAIAMVIIEN